MAALRDLAAEKSRRFRSNLAGYSLPAITLHTPPALAAQGRTAALTDNFLPVELYAILPANQLVQLRVVNTNPAGALFCEIDSTRRDMAVAS
jgi:hypothetical protein